MQHQTTSMTYRISPSPGSKIIASSPQTSIDYDGKVHSPIYTVARTTALGGLFKRAFDICGSAAALIFLFPLLGLLAALIKILDPGPVLHKGWRIGRNGIEFRCLKYRTMVTDADNVLERHLASDPAAAEEWEQARKLKNDPRITPLGRILRITSLDELPQLLNIFVGDMSFVGPRPIVTAEIPKYGIWFSSYLQARPGLTGAWQVSGRSDISFERRVTLDREYVENWSFVKDVSILFKTFRVVIAARGVY